MAVVNIRIMDLTTSQLLFNIGNLSFQFSDAFLEASHLAFGLLPFAVALLLLQIT